MTATDQKNFSKILELTKRIATHVILDTKKRKRSFHINKSAFHRLVDEVPAVPWPSPKKI